MRVNLKVPYKEKDAAKRKGARWDPARRCWYVQNVENIARFMRWMPRHLTYAHGKKLPKFRLGDAVDQVNKDADARLANRLKEGG